MVNQQPAPARVTATRIIGTLTVVYSAWEPSVVMGRHTTISHLGGTQCYGRIGTLVDGTTRQEQYRRAYRLIIDRHPEAAAGTRDAGEIILDCDPADRFATQHTERE
jgi:hypothetical protein